MSCIICLEHEYTFNIRNECIMCDNFICDKCVSIIDSFENYYIKLSTHISFDTCSYKCAKSLIIRFNKSANSSAFMDEMIENQHNIHISTLLPNHLNNYILSDLTNIVIDFLVE